MTDAPLTICYFGIYPPVAPRDRIYLDGLKRRGIRVSLCVDGSKGLRKFWRIAAEHRALLGQYDLLWVGYSSSILVPLARLLSGKKIVYNALNSWYETAIIDRAMYRPFSARAIFVWLVDFFAFHAANLSLLESEEQKKFIAKTFRVSPEKLVVVYTGADETVFHPDPSVAKNKTFTVIFRGMFLPATGAEFVIEAARLLKNEDINFRLIGWGEPLQGKIQKMIADYNLSRVYLTTVFMPADELRRTMLSAHVMLGAFGNNERLERTIQHKTFEALALGMPYITRDSESNRELLTDGVNVRFVPPADPKALATAVLELKDNPALRAALSAGARALYESKLKNDLLAGEVYKHCLRLTNRFISRQ
ncbi:glycosyltransferase [Patescibacteria group bacterium]|nr:glycosyltransferase [Patescibacteria group bacterium]